jgi:uncharacterized protein
MRTGFWTLNALILAVGLSLAGWFIGQGFTKGRAADRFITVKGVAERDVKADVALWPLSFVSTNDDLGRAQAGIRVSKGEILSFLEKNGITGSDTELQGLEVTDLLANPYRSGPTESRYIITQRLMVRSTDPDLIQATGQKIGELVDAGVILSSSGQPGNGPTFLFTRLNELKPSMIAEATANARQAAEQFAFDSGSRLGGIRQAHQGMFVILPRDRAPGIVEDNQLQKTVRVVSTIEYYLKD